jgi:hypothetical protein
MSVPEPSPKIEQSGQRCLFGGLFPIRAGTFRRDGAADLPVPGMSLSGPHVLLAGSPWHPARHRLPATSFIP